MLPRIYFDKNNGFDKDIFMYAEETLLCFQLRRKFKLKIFNVPSSKVIHYEGVSFIEKTQKQIEIMIDGNRVYFEKAFGVDEFKRYISFMIKYSKLKMIFSFKHRKQNRLKYLCYKKVKF